MEVMFDYKNTTKSGLWNLSPLILVLSKYEESYQTSDISNRKKVIQIGCYLGFTENVGA